MAKPLRLEYPNALYQFTSRGDRREDIYDGDGDGDGDRLIFLNILGKVVTDFNWLCRGYCLMSNKHFFKHQMESTHENNFLEC
ncbi:hypothetical protein AU255_01830 [Methyloprofundus sedimenti]|uniref:Uncharacterized protein n=1 Tax=Methyloprofundus sedimenti TaxID=1420851 RepID=A0A1V8M533_9GAMM|nr:hypothetical protein [Methyloprofundus sedimenti]OQK16671.1 hypothetical protein AU255_01830 [Methyloprofundus sedimenti]